MMNATAPLSFVLPVAVSSCLTISSQRRVLGEVVLEPELHRLVVDLGHPAAGHQPDAPDVGEVAGVLARRSRR